MTREKGKPIMFVPPPELREKIEAEAARQNRSMSNLCVVLLTKVFKAQGEAQHGAAQKN